MLRPRLSWGFVLAGALCVATPSFTQTAGGLSHDLDEAEKKLDADVKACKPIDIKEYSSLVNQARSNLQVATKAAQSGLPTNRDLVLGDLERAKKLADRANAAAKKPCPPQQAPQAAPPPKTAETPPTAPQPNNPFGKSKDPFQQLENDADDALDELDDAMDDCDEAAVKALIPKLERLSEQAHDVADTARGAGKMSKVDAAEAETMADDLDKAILDAKKFKCIAKPKTDYFRRVPTALNPVGQRFLAIHNQERSAVHAPPLKWDFKLEWHAVGYADHLSFTGELEHAPREGRGIERENLARTLIDWSPDQMLGPWIAEKKNFVPGYFPNVARDGNWISILHYTQMIWPTTTQVGCGFIDGGGYRWLVCRYSPGGNSDGEPVGPLFHQPERG